jgi:hypothetical protein
MGAARKCSARLRSSVHERVGRCGGSTKSALGWTNRDRAQNARSRTRFDATVRAIAEMLKEGHGMMTAKSNDIVERLRAAVAGEREAIMRLIESERARVPAGGEYYAGYREALLNLETAIRARPKDI